MFICHVAADGLGAIFLFIVNKQSCPPPFVSCDRKTLKSRNPSALNLPNDEENEGKGRERKHSSERTRVLRANPLLCIDNVYAPMCARYLHAVACELSRAPYVHAYTYKLMRTHDAHGVCRWTLGRKQSVCYRASFQSRILWRIRDRFFY